MSWMGEWDSVKMVSYRVDQKRIDTDGGNLEHLSECETAQEG